MKTTGLAALIMVALIGTGVAQASDSNSSVPLPAKHLTQKLAAQLINTANTPEDHSELAQYFHHEAQRKRNKEQYYMEVVATYRLHPPRVDMYRNTPTWCRYEQLAKEVRDEAIADDRRAFLEERFAQGLATPK
jgi:hypothetical protein